MKEINYLQALKHNWRPLIFLVAIVVLIGLGITAVQPFKYRSTVQLLVISPALGQDAYAAIRSAEKINNNLAHLVYTTSFRDKVLHYGFINQQLLPTEPIKRQKAWDKTVSAYVVPETGLLRLDIYHRDRTTANNLARAAGYVLSVSGQEYIGLDNLSIKIVDQPITSVYPVRPNIILNLAASLVLGALLALVYFLLSYNHATGKVRPLWIPRPSRRRQSAKTLVEPVMEKVDFSVPMTLAEAEPQAVAVKVDEAGEKEVPVENSNDFYKMLFPEKN